MTAGPRWRRAAVTTAGALVLLLTGCSGGAGAIAPPPAPPSTCVTPVASRAGSCVPVHNPPSRLYVEQAIPDLLPTRGYGSIGDVRCTVRMPDPVAPSDPSGVYRTSHWTCVGQEPEGTYLHEDVVWSPYGGLLLLNAVHRDRSPALTTPKPNDPGLPNPHASETAAG